MLATRKITKLEFGSEIYSNYSQLFITNLLYARPVKTITVCASYKLVFAVGIRGILVLVITVW